MLVYHKSELVGTYEISKNMKIRLPEEKLYDIEVQLTVRKGIVFGLSLVNTVSKGFFELTKQEYKQGSYAPIDEIQTASFAVRTPGGILGRGSYSG